MPNSNAQNQNKKPARLGRGLGSLLGGSSLDSTSALDEKAPIPAANKAAIEAAPLQQANTQHRPSTTAAAPASAQPVQAPVAAPAAAAAPAPAPAPVEQAKPVIADEEKIWSIPVERLTPNTQQPRQVFEPEALKELTASIKEKGILMPIVARRLSERQFEIIAGERRWRAAQAAGLQQVPVILKKVTEQASLELAIIENIQRANLSAMEEAEAFDHLMNEYSLTQQEVAERLGKERSTVANTLRLLTLPVEVKALVRSNELSAGHAKVLLSLENSAAQITLARQVVAEKLSVRATEKLVAKSKTDARAAKAAPNSPINVDVSKRLVEGLSAELQKLIGTRVAIDYADAKGKLSISFYSDDQLTDIVDRLREAWQK